MILTTLNAELPRNNVDGVVNLRQREPQHHYRPQDRTVTLSHVRKIPCEQ